MSTKTTSHNNRYMMDIDSEAVINEIRSKGYSLWKMSVLLNPHHILHRDSYGQFKYWMKHGRMPIAKYQKMRKILDGTV